MQWQRIVRPLVDTAIREALRAATRRRDRARPSTGGTSGRSPTAAGRSTGYPGDYEGPLDPVYAPEPDGRPDPGEVVWTWVPFEEDHTRGKDRPVLLVGHDGPWLLALQLSSRDHDLDAEQERRAGRTWVDIGTGAWDPRGRPSEARVNRVIRVHEGDVRREGAVLARERFEEVAAAVRAATGA